MEASFDKLLSYKAEGILLSFKKKTKSITPANGSAHQEEVLSTGVLVKRFGGYLGQLPLFEFRLKAEGFLSHPHQLLTGASSWKKAGGYLECEELVIEAGDLNVKVGGALTLTEGGQPENGALTVDLTQEGGVLKGIRRLTPFMMKGQGEEGKGEGGSHVLLPVTVHSGDWSIEDIPVFLDGKFCGESLKVLLSKLQEGKFTAD
jgi:hypothetical protein